MSESIKFEIEQINVIEDIADDCNIILGQSHFIKTVEDLYEAIITSAPGIEFGIAFCEASGECLIRYDGNSEELEKKAVEYMQRVNAGHTFCVLMRKCFPINILDRVKNVQEVCRVFAATANPLQVVIAESAQGRGIMGVIDGAVTRGVEDDNAKEWRRGFLRNITGYKK